MIKFTKFFVLVALFSKVICHKVVEKILLEPRNQDGMKYSQEDFDNAFGKGLKEADRTDVYG